MFGVKKIFIENDNFTVTNVAYCFYKKVTKNFAYGKILEIIEKSKIKKSTR